MSIERIKSIRTTIGKHISKITIEDILKKKPDIDRNKAEKLLETVKREWEDFLTNSYDIFLEEFLFNDGKYFSNLSEDELDEIHRMGNGVRDLYATPKSEWHKDWFTSHILSSTLMTKSRMVNRILDIIAGNKPVEVPWEEYKIPLSEYYDPSEDEEIAKDLMIATGGENQYE